MKYIILSDTHEKQAEIGTLPECDFLIHCGDMTYKGEFFPIRDFVQWFEKQPARYRICIVGNHELTTDINHSKYNPAIRAMLADNKNFHYLENNQVVLDGIKFYGSPAQPWFFDWGHNFQRGAEIRKVWAKIPQDVDVLITHGPPFGVLDRVKKHKKNGDNEHAGCADLLEIVERYKPKLHCFGHLHQDGLRVATNGITTFVNGAVLDDDYRFRAGVAPYVEIEL